MRAAETGVPLSRARVSPIHQCPRTSSIRSIASVLSRPGSMRVREKGTTAPRFPYACAPARSSCLGAPPDEGGITCKMCTTRERAMRRNVARPTPSVKWPRQRPARCQAGRSAGASPGFSGGEVHFVHANSVTVDLFFFSLMKRRGKSVSRY